MINLHNIDTGPYSLDDLIKFTGNFINKEWFNDYSEDHFIMKALNQDMNYFERYKHLILDNTYFADNCINCSNFLLNLFAKLIIFNSFFTKADIENFIKNQLSAGKNNYSEMQFFRALSEVHVLHFLMTFGPSINNAVYEPQLGKTGANPEARLFFADNITVDVEVKTPGFPRNFLDESKDGVILPGISLEENQRNKIGEICKMNNIEFILPRINKLKDYINSAGNKFQKPTNRKHINLLYINWTYTEFEKKGFFEPYTLLYNNINGILKDKKTALEVGIHEDALDKVTAVIIYQDTFNSIMFGDFRYHWQYYTFRLLPNLIMDQKFVDRDLLFTVTKMNPPLMSDFMMPYEIAVKPENIDAIFRVTDYLNPLIKDMGRSGEDTFTYMDKEYWSNLRNVH